MKTKHYIIILIALIISSIIQIKSFEIIRDWNKIEWLESDCEHSSYVWFCSDGKNSASCTQYKELVNGKWETKRKYRIDNPNEYWNVTKQEAEAFCNEKNLQSSCGF